MKWWIALGLLVILGAGFYFGYFKFDPVTFVVLLVVLFNDLAIMRRQQETANVITKSHEVTVANQKATLDAVKALQVQVRKK